MPKAADPLPSPAASGVRLRRGTADYLLGFWRARGIVLATFALALILAVMAASALPRGTLASVEITVSPASALLEERALLIATADAAAGPPGAFALRLGPSPQILVAAYQAGQAAEAEAGLETILRAYRAVRGEAADAGAPDAARSALEQAEQAIAALRAEYGEAGPEAAAAAISRAYEDEEREREALAARRREAEIRLAAYQARLDVFGRQPAPAPPAEPAELAALRRQRAELSLRYREGSQTLRDIDELIAQQEAHRDTSGVPAPQALDPDRRLAEAELAAARSELTAILARERQVQDRLERLSPAREASLAANAEYRRLAAAHQQAVDAAARAAPLPGRPELTFGETVVETRGLPLASTGIAAILSALAAALIAGLMRVFAETSLATPASVTRSLGLPVLAAVPER